jgi:hypothetical protein
VVVLKLVEAVESATQALASRSRAGDSATEHSANSAPLAEWWMRHKSLMFKVLVSCSFLLRHVATGPYSLTQIPAQRAPARNTTITPLPTGPLVPAPGNARCPRHPSHVTHSPSERLTGTHGFGCRRRERGAGRLSPDAYEGAAEGIVGAASAEAGV